MPEPLAYLNGRFLPVAQAALPLHDAGFVFGATVVDFCRTFRQKLYLWPEHLARFRHDCGECFIPLPQSNAEITEIAEELVRHNAALLPPEQELALIAFATPGPIGYYLGQPGGAGDGPPTLGLHTFPLPFARYRRFFEQGVRLQIVDAAAAPLPTVKHRSRLRWWLANHQLHSGDGQRADLALIQTGTGQVTDTAIGSFLAVIDGIVVVPERDQILDSISLRVVRRLCEKLAIPVAEGRVEWRRASEAMLAGSAFCLVGVRQINEVLLPWPGSVFQRLLAAWSDEVGVNVASQFLKPERTA